MVLMVGRVCFSLGHTQHLLIARRQGNIWDQFDFFGKQRILV
uniref:Uncharacterized protein n=1 Tax=Picea sitchensis TaxID=3332 RepID=A0A6B9XUW0_PICSI|nr:hypothetical protein Q903MT_gene3798 [Picea sitchensis]